MPRDYCAPERFRFVGFLCLLFSFSSSVGANVVPTECGLNLQPEDKIRWFKKRAVDLRAGAKFTPEAEKFFVDQRAKFRTHILKLNRNLVEMENAAKRNAQAMMLETFAYFYGPPGAAKSYLADEFLSTPVEQFSGKEVESYFRLQFNENLSDVPLRGYRNNEGELFTKETVLSSKYAKFDEIDKASPVAVAALLDLLNMGERVAQHGTETIRAELRAGAITSNMTIYEFLDMFQAQLREPTAKAFLDRNPFKVYFHNYAVNDKRVIDLLKIGAKRSEASAEELLMGFFNPERAQKAAKNAIDYSWFGALAKRLFVTDDDTLGVYANILTRMREEFNGRRLSTQRTTLEESGRTSGGYEPPTILSSRNAMNLSRDVVSASILYDLLILPEDVLPSSSLVLMLERGIRISPESAWRLQDFLLNTTPASVKLGLDQDELKLMYGDELTLVRKSVSDVKEERLIDDFMGDQERFASVYREELTKYMEANKSAAVIESDIFDLLGGGGPRDKKIKNIEEWLMQVQD